MEQYIEMVEIKKKVSIQNSISSKNKGKINIFSVKKKNKNNDSSANFTTKNSKGGFSS